MRQEDVHDDAGDDRAEGRREETDHQPLERADIGAQFADVDVDAWKPWCISDRRSSTRLASSSTRFPVPVWVIVSMDRP
jgi:hypothetical protein